MTRMLHYVWEDSPVGRLLIASDEEGLRFVLFGEGRRPVAPQPGWREDAGRLAEPVRQLREYFAGERRGFDMPLAPEGTPFQLRVWRELLRIPYGARMSYGELAQRIGSPEASRAVGLANGANPIAIVIPCHRVVGSNGHLTGYGGGLPRKEWLLALEGRTAPAPARQPDLLTDL